MRFNETTTLSGINVNYQHLGRRVFYEFITTEEDGVELDRCLLAEASFVRKATTVRAH
jgi:hypothetical protein